MQQMHQKILASQGFENVIDQFVPEKTLGKGFFGKVFLAGHKCTGGKFAIKFVCKSKIRTVLTQRGHEYEEIEVGELVSQNANENNLTVLESFEDHEYYYYVMEFMQGGDLINYLVKS